MTALLNGQLLMPLSTMSPMEPCRTPSLFKSKTRKDKAPCFSLSVSSEQAFSYIAKLSGRWPGPFSLTACQDRNLQNSGGEMWGGRWGERERNKENRNRNKHSIWILVSSTPIPRGVIANACIHQDSITTTNTGVHISRIFRIIL